VVAAPTGVVMAVYDSGRTTLPVASSMFQRAMSAAVAHSAPAAYGCVMLMGMVAL
jgi:hypothetical protein